MDSCSPAPRLLVHRRRGGAYRADLSVGSATSSRATRGDSRSTGRASSRLLGAGPGHAQGHRLLRRHVPHARDGSPEPGRQGRSAEGGAGLETRAIELNAGFQLTPKWNVSAGVRNDLREDHSPSFPSPRSRASAPTLVAQVASTPPPTGAPTASSRRRSSNEGQPPPTTGASAPAAPTARRSGSGSTARFGRGPGGGGTAGHQLPGLGADQPLPELLAGERAHGQRPAGPPCGTLVSGAKRSCPTPPASTWRSATRTRTAHRPHARRRGPSVARERWNLGANAEFGTLVDSRTSARPIAGRRASAWATAWSGSRSRARWSTAGRREQQLDLTHSERTAWLFRNNCSR